MDAKVPELLDLTKKLLDQSMEIVKDSIPSIESVPTEEVRYSMCTAYGFLDHSVKEDCDTIQST